MKHTLKMFNTGQITLPKKWREQHKTSHFVAEETAAGLLIKPLTTEQNTVFYETKDGFGLYFEEGIDPQLLVDRIRELDGQD